MIYVIADFAVAACYIHTWHELAVHTTARKTARPEPQIACALCQYHTCTARVYLPSGPAPPRPHHNEPPLEAQHVALLVKLLFCPPRQRHLRAHLAQATHTSCYYLGSSGSCGTSGTRASRNNQGLCRLPQQGCGLAGRTLATRHA